MDMNSRFKLKPTDLFICCISKEVARKNKKKMNNIASVKSLSDKFY